MYVAGTGAMVVGVLAAGWLTTGQEPEQWEPDSPAPFTTNFCGAANPCNRFTSGRVSSLAVDPRDPARWLVGAGNGGVWETRDAGETWSPVTDDAPTLAAGGIAFAPSNPDIVYAGTGESMVYTDLAHVGVGLLKSANGGATWSLLGQSSLARGSIKHVRVHPADPMTLLITLSRSTGGRDAAWPPSAPRSGVMRSTDGGNTWTRTLSGEPTALAVDPANFSRQFAAIAVGGGPNGIHRSTNGGVSWSLVNGPWFRDPANVAPRIEIAIAPSNPNVVYASVADFPLGATSGNLLGLYRTENAWDDVPNWVQIPTQATGAGGYCGETAEYAGRKCNMSHVISVDPLNADVLFAGGQRDLWRCSNCGASPTWTNVTIARRIAVEFHVLEWAGNRLIVGNDGGVFSSADMGATWQDHNRTLLISQFYNGALHPTDSGVVIGGLRDRGFGVFRSAVGWRNPEPATPTTASIAGEGEIAMSSSRPNTDWAGSTIFGRIISRTTDGGRTSRQVDQGIDKTGAAQTPPMKKCPANDDVMLVATYRIWRSDNFFSATQPSWSAQTPERPFPAGGFESRSDPGVIHGLTFAAADRTCATYAYGTRGGQVRLTRNGGASWTDLDPQRGLPARPINDLEFDPGNPDRLFVAVSSYDVATPNQPGHIFRTENALSSSPTWTRVGPPGVPFADMPFNVIRIDPRNTRTVYAGSDNGLWKSSDGGATFAKVGRESGLPPASIYDIQINPTTGRTMLFTYGRGAFVSTR